MESKFNFYDFVGYVIPGALIAGIIHWTLNDFSIHIRFGALGSLGGSIVFLIISYLFGHILAALGKHLAGKTKASRSGYSFVDYRYSIELLKKAEGPANPMYSKDPRTDYSDDFKNKLKEAIKAVWMIDTGNPTDDKAVQKAFELSYAFVVSKNLNPHIEIFNAFYGFYRNLLAAFWMSLFLISIIFLHNLFLAIFFETWHIDPSDLEKKIYPNLVLSLLSVLVLLFLGKPVRKRQEDYGKAFASTVYASFLAWYHSSLYTKKMGIAEGEKKGGQ